MNGHNGNDRANGGFIKTKSISIVAVLEMNGYQPHLVTLEKDFKTLRNILIYHYQPDLIVRRVISDYNDYRLSVEPKKFGETTFRLRNEAREVYKQAEEAQG